MVMKIAVFLIAVLSFSSAATMFLNVVVLHRGDFDIVFEDSYYQSRDYGLAGTNIIRDLKTIQRLKNKETILSGQTLDQERIKNAENQLFNEFQYNSNSYNPNGKYQDNYKTFLEVYADKITQAKNELIKQDLNDYNLALQDLANYQGIIYFAKKGETEYTNSPNKARDYFKAQPSYILWDGYESEVFPQEVKDNNRYYWLISNSNDIEQQDIIYVAYTDEYINPKLVEWQDNKQFATHSLFQLGGLLLVLAAALLYLMAVIGRNPQEEDEEIHLNVLNRIYNDVNIGLCILLIALWAAAVSQLEQYKSYELFFFITLLISSLGLLLFLSLVKHLKNKTFIKNTLVYKVVYKFIYKFVFRVAYKVVTFFRDVYNSGSTGVKVILIVVGYPVLAAITFFIFPITLGAAAWLALRKVKEFNTIKEGVKRVKEGDIHHSINIVGEGEFASLAADINSITDGLYKAVDNEIKSERLKTELITNVSHDIRTPLTSIITYVDLLKKEKEPAKIEGYLEIIDQKSQRLKVLTDDLFEAAKASSGNIQVNFETINLISLITQGLGELDDKIQERQLDFKLSYPNDKLMISADGKLLWRAIENLLSNIFKYALQGSRVYINIANLESEVALTIKNISAYELNISSDELMERFKRGDESRSSQGSGLGLSIAKSLIELQKGSFNIEIDGDLFKVNIQLPQAD
ncbi:sensor histidine kinase [Desulfosporosinus orientis]|nr:HAMP domain-containing sensor histidine kinase [Desulfosporosinus orientis]